MRKLKIPWTLTKRVSEIHRTSSQLLVKQTSSHDSLKEHSRTYSHEEHYRRNDRAFLALALFSGTTAALGEENFSLSTHKKYFQK